MEFADKNKSKQYFCISIFLLRRHQPHLLPRLGSGYYRRKKIENIQQENLFDVLLVVEEETVSKHSEGMQRSVKVQAIICAPFIHIKLKSQTLCPIDGNMHWSESRLDLRVISWFLSTFCPFDSSSRFNVFFPSSLCSGVSKRRVCVQCWQVSDIFIPLCYIKGAR